MGDYHDIYLKSDVTLLGDVFQTFRETCLDSYGLDPAHYFTAPGLSWEAMLKYTKAEPDYLHDIDMHLFVENGMRGGISIVSKRYVEVKNPYLPNYDSTKEHNYIMYLDAHNLYGQAMSQELPYSNFEWGSVEDYNCIKEGTGQIIEADMEYPTALQVQNDDYLLTSEKLDMDENWLSPYQRNLLEGTMSVPKLVPNLVGKNNYVVHHRVLKFYESQGLKVTKVHRVLKFKEKPWIASYINLNAKTRKKATTTFEKDFEKLMNNSVFGKTKEKIRKRVDIKLLKTDDYGPHIDLIRRTVSAPNFHRRVKFSDELSAFHMKKVQMTMDKPVYAGFSVPELSKLTMYKFYYKVLKKKYGPNCSMMYTDTDSLELDIKTDDMYKDMLLQKDEYDLSEYPTNHFLFDQTNKKVIGKMKDKCAGAPISKIHRHKT